MRSIPWWRGLPAWLRFAPRSNGVRVARGTAWHIGAGNAARARRDWTDAARAYRAALTREPGLQHIWIQLGHMEKEDGAPDRAGPAFERAAELAPHDIEPLLRLGQLAKAWRQPCEAAGYFMKALARDPASLEAISELVRLLPDRATIDPASWATIAAALHVDSDAPVQDTVRSSAGTTVFDVTDLLAFVGQRRLPTGIQRVQIEVALACLDQDIPSIFAVYSSARRGWIALPEDVFAALCRLARQGDDVRDPAWLGALRRLHGHIVIAPTLRLAPGTLLVNLGTSWTDRNYLLDVRVARARHGMIYVPLVFDLIPLIGPHWFAASAVRDYRLSFGSLLHSVDGCLAISEATRRDLVYHTAAWHAPLPEAAVRVVPLDGDFRQPAADPGVLAGYGLVPDDYVLFVSTLEPRKNHRGAFAAWLALGAALGEAAVPRLVCVGGRGWLNDDLHAMLRAHPLLRRKVLILHGVPDDVLASLYEQCRFALYPSLYEGWGLPVSEALSYGKVPAISRVSSLPEAGGVHARYFDPADPADIAAVVRTLLDDDTRHRAEAAIRRDYAPRAWPAIARDMVAQARTIAARTDATLPCLDAAGTWTLALPRADDGARPGEALRHGRAWHAPGLAGCGIDGDDASLWFRWAGPAGCRVQVHVAAAGPAAVAFGDGGARTDVSAQGATILSWPLPPTPAIVRLPIVPIHGAILVERVVVSAPAAA